MSEFSADYLIFVFVATLGVLQIAASVGQLRGLLILKSDIGARALGLFVAVGAAAWFFGSGERNVNDYEGGVDANGQALFFFLGALAGVATTLVVTSLVNLRLGAGDVPPREGLDALRDSNYARALWRSLLHWSKRWRTLTRSFFSG